jgi:hypothetical protein
LNDKNAQVISASPHREIPIREQSGGDQGPEVDQGGEPADGGLQPEDELVTLETLCHGVAGGLPVAQHHPDIHHPQKHVEVPTDPSHVIGVLLQTVLRRLGFFPLLQRLGVLVLVFAEAAHDGAVGGDDEEGE